MRKKSFYWPVFVAVLSCFWAVETPLALIFQHHTSPFIVLNCLMSVVLIADVWMNRPQHDVDVLILKEKKWHVQNWPIFALLVSLPWDLCMLSNGSLRYLALLKVFRILCLIRTYREMNSLSDSPRPIRLFMIFTGAVVAVHLVASAWLAINPTPDLTPTASYLRAFYWAVTTLTTTGYGDITPTSDIGRLFTIVIMLIGFSAFGIIVGNISNLIMAKNRHEEAGREKMEDLALFMKHYEIPGKLRSEVLHFFSHRMSKRLSEDDDKIISDLPSALQKELKIYMKIKLIDRLPVFHGLSKACLTQVSMAMAPVTFHSGETIIHKGDQGEEMFIIDHGEVEVLNENNIPMAVLKHGQCFGEMALLKETNRTANIRTRTYCDVYCLNKKDFLSISKDFPELEGNFRKIMNRRVHDRAA